MKKLLPANATSRAPLLPLLLLLLFGVLPPPASAAPGDLDLTFGIGGKVTTPIVEAGIFNLANRARAVALQADGKIVAAGFVNGAFISSDFALIRYQANGALDPSFGNGGIVFTPLSLSEEAGAIIIQNDGKIVLGGGSNNAFLLARYNPNGSLDASFGSDGLVFTDLPGGQETINGLALLPDGKIVAVGTVRSFGMSGDDFALARYHTDGSLDMSFGVGGTVITDFLMSTDRARALLIQPDGKLIAGGVSSINMMGFALVRYQPDGSLDASFGNGGFAQADFLNAIFEEIHALALQADGRIVAAGSVQISGSPTARDFALARFLANGQLDNGFGNSGRTTLDMDSHMDSAFGVAIQNNGQIVLAGRGGGEDSVIPRFALARYHHDGVLDTSFGVGGRVKTPIELEAVAAAVVIQPDGKILAAGYTRHGFFGDDFALARYDGSSFDICLQDSGNFFQLNSTTGDYRFTSCPTTTLSGRGVITRRGAIVTLQHNSADRRVQVKLDGQVGTASLQLLPQRQMFTILDRDLTNGACQCATP